MRKGTGEELTKDDKDKLNAGVFYAIEDSSSDEASDEDVTIAECVLHLCIF